MNRENAKMPRHRKTGASDTDPLKAPEDKSMRERFREKIARSEKSRLRARKRGKNSLWFGFGYFGVVGWLVMIPIIICLAIGIWLDTQTEGTISWTLTFFFIGLAIGLANAWLWISRQRKDIEEERKEQ
ncbi:MAG: ATPase F0F1 [Chitinivibrionales bacterium]|nr:ATPase F0F1 [Chitinivibrionales bacterium]